MRTRVALLGAALLMMSVPASADSFVLRPPSNVNLDFEGNMFVFVADGFSAEQAFLSQLGIFFGANPGCDPCSAGDIFDPSFTVTNAYLGFGPATIGGTTYADASYFGDLSFVATPVVFPGTGALGYVLSTPFTFTGTLRGFEGGSLAFSAALSGVGFAARGFDRGGLDDGLYFASENRLVYTFTESAAATPEPASLLLLGTGVATLIARKRLTSASPSR